MKKIISVCLALFVFNLSLFAVSPSAETIKRGTGLLVRLTSTASSNQKGTVSAIVENDVFSTNDELLISRGTPVELQVIRKKAKGVGKAGEVTVRCLSTKAVDDQLISLDGSISDEGASKQGLALGLGLSMGLFVLPGIGFAFLAIKGEKGRIESNTVIPNVVVTNSYKVAIQ